jgi:hypothetical protein
MARGKVLSEEEAVAGKKGKAGILARFGGKKKGKKFGGKKGKKKTHSHDEAQKRFAAMKGRGM